MSEAELDGIWLEVVHTIVQAEEGRVRPLTADQRYELGVDFLANEYDIEDGELVMSLEYMDYDDGVFFKDMEDIRFILG